MLEELKPQMYIVNTPTLTGLLLNILIQENTMGRPPLD